MAPGIDEKGVIHNSRWLRLVVMLVSRIVLIGYCENGLGGEGGFLEKTGSTCMAGGTASYSTFLLVS